jgi:tripartite-type tricarboxylate transporter receptor subunit TctC
MAKIRGLLVGLLCVFTAATAQAQSSYPNRPIRLIVSIAAGSVTDVIVRKASLELQPRLGQPLIIENRGTASGIIAAQACAHATPDGYTLCVLHHDAMSYNQLHYENLPYDPARDFTPITRLYFINEGLFVSPALGTKSVADVKAFAQSHPDKLNFATLGDGSFPDLFLRWLNNQWGTKIVGIPYAGGGPAAQAVAANQVQITKFGIGNFLGLVKAGNVKPLAVSSEKRSPLMPDVPTFDEVGLSGYPGKGWWGLVGPKGTPPEVVSKMNAAFAGLFRETSFAAYLESQAAVPAPTTPEEFARFLIEDRNAAETLVKIANTKREEYKPQ